MVSSQRKHQTSLKTTSRGVAGRCLWFVWLPFILFSGTAQCATRRSKFDRLYVDAVDRFIFGIITQREVELVACYRGLIIGNRRQRLERF